MSWLRWSWVIAALAVLGGAVGFASSSLGSTDSSASATLGLSEQVSFQLIGPTVETHRSYASADGLLSDLADGPGLDPAGVMIRATSDSSLVVITATAPDAERAEQWANAAADFVSQRGQADRLTRLDDQAAAFTVIAEEADANINELSQALVTLENERAAAGADDPALASIIAETRIQLSNENTRRIEVGEELINVERDRAVVTPMMGVIGRASAGTPPASNRTPILLGAVFGLLLGLALTPSIARHLGRVRSVAHPELLGLGDFVDLTSSTASDVSDGHSGLPLLAALHHTDGPIGLVSAGPVDLDEVASNVTALLGRTATVVGTVGDAELGQRTVETSSIAVLVRQGQFSRRRLLRLMNDLERLGVNVEVVALVGDRLPTWPRLSDS